MTSCFWEFIFMKNICFAYFFSFLLLFSKLNLKSQERIIKLRKLQFEKGMRVCKIVFPGKETLRLSKGCFKWSRKKSNYLIPVCLFKHVPSITTKRKQNLRVRGNELVKLLWISCKQKKITYYVISFFL